MWITCCRVSNQAILPLLGLTGLCFLPKLFVFLHHHLLCKDLCKGALARTAIACNIAVMAITSQNFKDRVNMDIFRNTLMHQVNKAVAF